MPSAKKPVPVNMIHHGDCLEFLRSLPSDCMDLIVSSPPYNIGKEYENRQALDAYLAQQSDVLRECVRCLKQSGSIFWQVGAYAGNGTLIPLDIRFFPILESLGMIPRNRIVWVRQHGLHAKNKFSARHETLLWFTKSDDYKFNLDAIRVPQKYQNKKAHRGENKGELTCNPLGKNPGDIWIFQNVKHNHHEQTIHPCQFPEDMITRVVLGVTDEGDVVFDPYMGTGTVAVVARDTQRQYLGAELDPTYYEVAERRISGLPSVEGSFANLKCLRAYCARSGEPVGKFRFDVQVGERPTESERSKRLSEQEHLESLEERLGYEEDAFVARVTGKEAPKDPHAHLKPITVSSSATATAELPLFQTARAG